MIPVLLGGVLIQGTLKYILCNYHLGRRYSIYEVLAVLLMTLGLICFTLVDVSIQPKFTLFGKLVSYVFPLLFRLVLALIATLTFSNILSMLER